MLRHDSPPVLVSVTLALAALILLAALFITPLYTKSLPVKKTYWTVTMRVEQYRRVQIEAPAPTYINQWELSAIVTNTGDHWPSVWPATPDAKCRNIYQLGCVRVEWIERYWVVLANGLHCELPDLTTYLAAPVVWEVRSTLLGVVSCERR